MISNIEKVVDLPKIRKPLGNVTHNVILSVRINLLRFSLLLGTNQAPEFHDMT
jgi:hypothetical protein